MTLNILGLTPPTPPTPDPNSYNVSELASIVSVLSSKVRNIPCCCDQGDSGRRITGLHISGTPTEASVTETATMQIGGCVVPFTEQYYWWNCVVAQHAYDKDPAHHSDWHSYGFHEGNNLQTETHYGMSPYLSYWLCDSTDDCHWNWTVAVVYIYWGKDGSQHAGLEYSTNHEEPTWQNGGWTDPHSGGISYTH